MILDPTRQIQIVLAGAVSANQPEWTINWDTYGTDGKLALPSHNDGVMNSNTDVTLLAAPNQGMRYEVLSASIYNKDTASITLTVKTDSAAGGGTEYIIHKVVLLTLESLKYQKGRGWYAFDANGNVKEALSAATNWAVSGNLTVGGNTTLGDAAADSLTINSGVFSAPNIPCFLAYNSATDTNQTGNGAGANIQFDTEVFDQGSNFSSNVFTAPVTGKYHFSLQVMANNLSAAMTNQICELVTSNRSYRWNSIFTPDASGIIVFAISAVADMDAADTAQVSVTISSGAGNTAGILGGGSPHFTYFSGHQVA